MATGKVWQCRIGPANEGTVPSGGDSPMRAAVKQAFEALLGHPPPEIFSGWGQEFDTTMKRCIKAERRAEEAEAKLAKLRKTIAELHYAKGAEEE